MLFNPLEQGVADDEQVHGRTPPLGGKNHLARLDVWARVSAIRTSERENWRLIAPLPEVGIRDTVRIGQGWRSAPQTGQTSEMEITVPMRSNLWRGACPRRPTPPTLHRTAVTFLLESLIKSLLESHLKSLLRCLHIHYSPAYLFYGHFGRSPLPLLLVVYQVQLPLAPPRRSLEISFLLARSRATPSKRHPSLAHLGTQGLGFRLLGCSVLGSGFTD